MGRDSGHTGEKVNKMKNLIRYSVLFISVIMGFYLIYLNYESVSLLLTQVALVFLWILLPFYLYLFISRKKNIIYSILPPIFILPLYLLVFFDYISSESSTAAIGLIFLPLLGFAAVGISSLMAWIFEKISNRA